MAINFQMYGDKLISNRYLVLGADPFDSEESQTILKQLGVFYYRDSRATDGVGLILTQPDHHVKAYYYQGVMDDSEWEIDEWANPTADYVARYGDGYAWLLFGKQKVVIEVQKDRIRVQSV